ncbi:hypothetical protein [Clostridium sp.]|jgi:hypothetical protein|uniref:hypothetical protein n=1 Tax=Clostridium sp. TaxID=1506 RepID=UPI00205D90B0|nr:hypothetical protein [Clostridium sp.]MDU7212510.1 hypothetical protein [Clostridium sp.]DAE86120.1 MAG TPA: hypothetical protein [Caudoviricetes sp.]
MELPSCMYDYRHENPQAKKIYTCSCCGYGIYIGDAYWNISGQIICEECIEHLKNEAEEG